VMSIVKFTRVEFTIEITSAAGRTKLKKVWAGALDLKCFLCVFCVLGHRNRWKWGPGAHPGPGRHADTKRTEKVHAVSAFSVSLLGPFSRLFETFSQVFF